LSGCTALIRIINFWSDLSCHHLMRLWAMSTIRLSDLNDADLTSEVTRLAADERGATAALIVHLAEFDARRLYEGAGYSSMFKYCVSVLHLSEDAAYNRIETARAAGRYPVIIDMLTSGALSLTTARMLARHLTPDNHGPLLAAAAAKGKQAVEELLAGWFPRRDVSPNVRKVPVRVLPLAAEEPAAVAAAPYAAVADASPASAATDPDPQPQGMPAPWSRAKPAVVRPLAPARYEIRFTASAETRDKLRRAQDLLSHALPSGDISEVVDRALTLLVADLERKKFAATRRPQPPKESVGDGTVPAAVQRAVTARDKGRCAFVSVGGHCCGERRFLEFHHVIPRARGGRATVENIQLRCRAHNGYEVDLFFGPGVRRTRDGARAASAIGRGVSEERARSGTTCRP
jgi:5-methylcytosine-specific restriction endonuclease McrA